jgi:predicted transposase YbfD/YdcC
LRREATTEARHTKKGHGRRVTRHLQASRRLAGHLDWPGLQQVLWLERTTVRGKRTTIEVQYAITSLSAERASAPHLLEYWVGHWGIENRLHWVRDAVLGEDSCRENKGHNPQNLAALRNAGLSLLRLRGIKEILSALRRFTTHSLELMEFLGSVKK